jgi:hypothetical protein
MGTTRLGWLALATLSLSLACASNRGRSAGELGAIEVATTLTVRNDNWLDVAVYLVRGASRFRIGTVTGTGSQIFRLPPDATSAGNPIRVMADPIGATRGYVTEPIVLSPGQRLEVRVGSPISVSSFAVWNR